MFSTLRLETNTLRIMADDYNRLLNAAKELKKLHTPSDIAKYIGEYDQMMTNWKARGIPKGKVIDIANKIGCNPIWLRDGIGMMAYSIEKPKTATQIVEQREAAYKRFDSLIDDLSSLPEEDIDIFKQEIRLAAMKARKKQQEKSDRELAAKALDPPSEVRRTA